MVRNKQGSWLDYIQSRQSDAAFLSDQPKIEDMYSILEHHHQSSGAIANVVPFAYLMDYTTGEYPKTSGTANMLFGYEPHQFTHGGVAFTLENYHKSDMRLFNEEIFPERLAVLKSIPSAEHARYIFSYTFRFRNKKNEYITLLQRNCFIRSDAKGGPLLSMGILSDVTHFTPFNRTTQVIEKIGARPEDAPEVVYKKVFYLHEEDRLFSAREKEVLLWTADGLTSKEIAEKLFLSENTIINHRRNMMAKSNTKNIAALVSFALRQHLI